jgi:hypothetical protein
VTAAPPGPVDGRPADTGPGGRLAAEAGAVVGAACVALHGVTALTAGEEAAWERGLLLVMAAVCVPCILRLRRTPTRRAWAMTGGMYAAMLAAHLSVEAPWSPAGGMSHSMAGRLTWADLGMWGGMALAGIQLALAVAVLGRPAVGAGRGTPGPWLPEPLPQPLGEDPWSPTRDQRPRSVHLARDQLT